MATVFRSALITEKRPIRRTIVAFVTANLLLTTLATPVKNTWPLPPRVPQRNYTYTQNLLQGTLEGFTRTTPFAQTDWPSPQYTTRRSLARDHTWVQNLLQSTLEGFTTTTPFAQTDWPNPARVSRVGLTWNQNLLQGTLEGFTRTTPFAPFAWPIWIAKDDPKRISLTVFRREQPQEPFVQSDWPLATPSSRAALWRNVNWYQNPTGTVFTLTAPAPFMPTDWPLPLRVRVRDYTWTQNQQLPLILEDFTLLIPFVQLEWPIFQKEYLDVTWIQRPSSALLVPAEAPNPFFVTEWPVPRRLEKPDLSWTQNLLQTTLEGFTLVTPFSQWDWPVPKSRFYSGIPLGASASTPQDLLATVPPATLTRLVALSLDIDSDLSQTISWTGNVLPVSIITSAPAGAPPGNKGAAIYVSGGVVRIYVWDGVAWQVLS